MARRATFWRSSASGISAASLFGSLWLVAGVVIAVRCKLRPSYWIAACGVGLMVAAAWWFNFHLAVDLVRNGPRPRPQFHLAVGGHADVRARRRPARN